MSSDGTKPPPAGVPTGLDVPKIKSEDGAAPYPDPNDRVTVAIWDPATGEIRQTVQCALQDMERQHTAWPGHEYLEVPDTSINPHDYVVDLKTRIFIPRTTPSRGDLSRKEQEIWIAARDATKAIQSAATGASLNYPNLDMGALALACLVGGEIETAAGRIFHTEEQAKTLARDFAAARNGADAKLATLRSAASAVKSRTDLDTITW